MRRAACSVVTRSQFFKRLEGAQNRFAVIADYFSQGVFNKVTIVSEKRAVGTVQGSLA